MKTNDNTNATGIPQPADQLPNDIQTVDQLEKFDQSHSSRMEEISNDAVKGAAWLLGIVGIFALAILIVWMANINNSPLSNLSARATVKRTAVTPPAHIPSLATAEDQYLNKLATVKISPVQKVKLTPAEKTTASAISQTDMDRINREALEVIHGDYGNNPLRKAKLGSDYAAVQARVNQLLHI